jgi:hypothetical protein
VGTYILLFYQCQKGWICLRGYKATMLFVASSHNDL